MAGATCRVPPVGPGQGRWEGEGGSWQGEPELLEDTQQAPEGLALEGRREGRRGQDLAFRPLREAT